MRAIFWCAAVIMCLCSQHAMAAETTERVIVVTGEGRASASPDMALVDFGVTAQAPRAQQAMDDVSEDVRKIFQTVLDLGIAPRDVQTTALRLDPVWNNRSSGNTPPEISGFMATNEIRLRLRDMTNLGSALQSILDSGANRFSNIRFTIADPAPLREAARREAVADAFGKASLFAEAAGVSLGKVLVITEAGASSPRPMAMAESRMAFDSAVPVAGGELDITARVTVTYAIAN